jgi:hypothetical protein
MKANRRHQNVLPELVTASSVFVKQKLWEIAPFIIAGFRFKRQRLFH